MLQNLQVKEFLSRLMDGIYHEESSLSPAYPTLNIRTATVSAKTADYTVTVADLKKPTIFTNTGAAGTVVFTLPTVATGKSKVVRVNLLAAQIVRIDPAGSEVANYNGSVVAGKYVQVAGVIGNYVELFCDGKQWIVTQANGVVTKEA